MELTKIQDYIYSIFVEFDRICKKHNLKYSMEGGTLLGAVKYQGFVPWDDDIDVIMFRDDYEKFLKVAPSELGKDFVLQSFNNIPNFPLNYAKLCFNGTKICDYAYSHIKEMNHGVFMDIFPVDYVKKETLKKHCRSVGVLTGARTVKVKYKVKLKGFKLFVYKILALLPIKVLNRQINKVCTRYNKDGTEYIYEVCNSNRKFAPMPSSMYFEHTTLKFRDGEFMALKKYDEFLKSRFGENYMTDMPSEEKRIPSHHKTVILIEQEKSD